MFIEPDLCSVLTVKLFTVNKFKMAWLEVWFLKGCEDFNKKWNGNYFKRCFDLFSQVGKLFGKHTL